jgi:hypothetical protein
LLTTVPVAWPPEETVSMAALFKIVAIETPPKRTRIVSVLLRTRPLEVCPDETT